MTARPHRPFRRMWEDVTTNYLTRHPTFPSDRETALEEIMERLRKALGLEC